MMSLEKKFLITFGNVWLNKSLYGFDNPSEGSLLAIPMLDKKSSEKCERTPTLLAHWGQPVSPINSGTRLTLQSSRPSFISILSKPFSSQCGVQEASCPYLRCAFQSAFPDGRHLANLASQTCRAVLWSLPTCVFMEEGLQNNPFVSTQNPPTSQAFLFLHGGAALYSQGPSALGRTNAYVPSKTLLGGWYCFSFQANLWWSGGRIMQFTGAPSWDL